jgi:hypothetical protein
VAFAYLAIYGENNYTLALVNATKNLANPVQGFSDVTLENGTVPIPPTGAWYSYTDKTNELVLAACYYALGTSMGEISLQPTSAPPGTSVLVSGSGLAQADTSCTISSSPSGLISNPQCGLSSGVLSGSFTVATGASGPYTVTATGTGATTGDAASAPFIPSLWSLLDGPTPDAPALASSSQLFLAARGTENGIWFRSTDSSGTWSLWTRVPGFTDVRPAIAVFNSRLYFVCKEAGTSNIWYGYYPLSGGVVSGSFSGWTLLPGPTPAALSATTDGSYLYVAAEGPDGSIWHQRMSAAGVWSGWTQIPGFTDVAPAIAIFNSRLYFACKERSTSNIWYSYVSLASYPSGWSGWVFLAGPTPDALTLTVSANHLYVAARGMENGVWYRSLDTSGTWTNWSALPGYTSSAIGICVYSSSLRFAAREAATYNLWTTTRLL